MELSNTTKAKVLSQYIGHKVLAGLESRPILTHEKSTDEQIAVKTMIMIPSCKLILRSISDITDEDAIGVSHIIGKFSFNRPVELVISEVKDLIIGFNDQCENFLSAYTWFEVYQYLILKGYDMPHHLLCGKTLEEVGLAIYLN